jgi:protein tyrosine/serine phosphatase
MQNKIREIQSRWIRWQLYVVIIAICQWGTANLALAEDAAHHPWATPMTVEGLANLFKVSDDYYRGAQPTAEGINALKNMGIKTIINLRSWHSDRDEIGQVEIGYENIPMNAWHLEEEDIIAFLTLISDKNRLPVFVHCQHGADRTGTITAMYRIFVQGWTKEEAIQEMTQGGFGFHTIWRNIVPFIQKLNIENIKKALEVKNEK